MTVSAPEKRMRRWGTSPFVDGPRRLIDEPLTTVEHGPENNRRSSGDSFAYRLTGSRAVIPQRFISRRSIPCSAVGSRPSVQTGRSSARQTVAHASLEEEVWVPPMDEVAWTWRQVACFLVVLLLFSSITYIYAQGAAAFFQNLNQPFSPGSEWEALASSNTPIPAFPLNSQFP